MHKWGWIFFNLWEDNINYTENVMKESEEIEIEKNKARF